MSQPRRDSERIGGIHAVAAALESGASIGRLWLAEGGRRGRHEPLMAEAERRGIPIESAPMKRLDDWLPGVRHQGCIAELKAAREYRESELGALLAAAPAPSVLALDQVQDPHNLGACLRSAAAAGISAVIAPRKRAAGLTASARKVAAGAAERVPFVPVTNLARALDRLKVEGLWVVGLDGQSDRCLFAAELPSPVVWVAGGEASGIRDLTAKHCDLRVAIPMADGIESLNVSVATGIALFEMVRQRAAAD